MKRKKHMLSTACLFHFLINSLIVYIQPLTVLDKKTWRKSLKRLKNSSTYECRIIKIILKTVLYALFNIV